MAHLDVIVQLDNRPLGLQVAKGIDVLEAEIARKVAMEQAKYNKDQVRACTVRNPAPNRLRPVSDVIRDILLEEKANLVKNRINTESSQ